jgi:hypothetical protein
MPLPLTPTQVPELYGTLACLLDDRCPAVPMRKVAGDAGWVRELIPDGLDESGQFARKPIIVRGIDAQWAQWDEETKATRVRGLARALLTYLRPKGMADDLNARIGHCGFHFENGDFVPVDATGRIPA